MTGSRPGDVDVVAGPVPGAIGRIAEMHGTYYHRHWQFGLYFEATIARDVADFLERFDDARDGFWTVQQGGCIEGSIAIDAAHVDTVGAHLRWFLLAAAVRGDGLGGRLLDTALGFCRARGYSVVHLWTFAGLDAARHLYERAGFRLVEERAGTQWGTEVREQRFELSLDRTLGGVADA